jgi:ferrous iron transport protein A
VRLRNLCDLGVGESGVLVALDLPPGVQNHLMYMGFVPDAQVKVLHRAPVGDPTVYSVDGIEIALRRETAKSIRVSPARLETKPQPARESEPEAELVEAIR